MTGTLQEGDEFAGYRIVRRLGVGGMGEVYLAQHPRLPRQDALKVLAPAFQNDEQFRERFTREADVAATLLHPNIVPLYDRGDHRDRLWISMAYIDGSDAGALAQTLPDRVFAGDLVAEIVSAIADALDHAHDNGLLHRDVKPGNILVTHTRRRRIYLADFGIAKAQDAGTALTSTGAFIGSLAYCAPEQAAADHLTGAADQYQLACTAFELLTGAPPYPGTNLVQVLHQHLNSPPPSPRSRRPELPGELDAVFAQALAKDPAQRYRRCSDFADALVDVLDSLPAPPPGMAAATGPASTVVATTPVPAATSGPWHQPTVSGTPPPQPIWSGGSGPMIFAPPQHFSSPGFPGPPIRWSGFPLLPEQLRGLSCGAYFALEATSDPVDDLFVTGSKRHLRKKLRDTWGIVDAESADETVDLLQLGMDAPDYDPTLRTIRNVAGGTPRGALVHERDRILRAAPGLIPSILDTVLTVASSTRDFPEEIPGSVAAWDLSRLVIIVRYCVFLGYLDPDVAWSIVVDAGRRAAGVYPHWGAYAAGFEVGRALSRAEGDRHPARAADGVFAESRPIILRLLSDPTSPWIRLPLR